MMGPLKGLQGGLKGGLGGFKGGVLAHRLSYIVGLISFQTIVTSSS